MAIMMMNAANMACEYLEVEIHSTVACCSNNAPTFTDKVSIKKKPITLIKQIKRPSKKQEIRNILLKIIR
jgi:hypothetical protein